jgi:hypothetical protein
VQSILKKAFVFEKFGSVVIEKNHKGVGWICQANDQVSIFCQRSWEEQFHERASLGNFGKEQMFLLFASPYQ